MGELELSARTAGLEKMPAAEERMLAGERSGVAGEDEPSVQADGSGRAHTFQRTGKCKCIREMPQ